MATAAASGEKSSHESPPRSRRLSALIGITCLLAVLGGWYFLAGSLVHWLTARDIDNFVLRSRDSSDQIATNLARNMQDEVRRLANLPEALSGDLVLRAPLTGRQDPQSRVQAVQEANERLRQVADQLEIDLLYLLDANGLCIAASNYQSDKSVIGTDLKARQYYTAIQNGGRGRQFAFGSASGTPGVYFSAAITRDGQFLGGVVVKRNMRNLFHLTSRNAAFLVDEYGVAVAATVEQALWRYLPDSAAAGLGTDFLQDRYRQSALQVLGIRADRSLATVSLVHLLDDPTPSLMTARPIGDSGLRLVYFTPVPDLLAMRERAQMTFWLVFVTGALILTLIAGAISYILQSRRRVTALRYSYQKLSALSRELAAEKETAQAADRAKSRFLATMSHELRTPFSGILGMVEVLRGSAGLPGEALAHVRLLERSARALLGLLNDILDFSKIDAGQITVETVAFDLKPVVDDLQQIQSVVTAAKGIGLSVRGTERPLIGLGDPDRLRQILNNFLSNAIKFTALGGIEVVVQTAGEGSARRLTISVTDSGAGMASDTRDNLFKPFYQGDASTTRRHGGTGLGLAISKRIAEAMGGSIGVKSEPGLGSVFWLDVPFPENDGRVLAAEMRQAESALAAKAPPVVRRRLLLADDDEVNRLVIGGMLRRIGHDVVFALNGRQAVHEVTRQQFDLVIMDMHMPEMDGIEATRAIRTLPGGRGQIPVVGLTADAIAENRPQYMAAGLDDLLTKPISAPDLAAVIRRYTEPVI